MEFIIDSQLSSWTARLKTNTGVIKILNQIDVFFHTAFQIYLQKLDE